VEDLVELETEPGRRDAERPDLGVLAVTPFRPVLPLAGQMAGDGVPLEAPWLDPVRRPSGDVVLAGQVLGDEELREVVIVATSRVVAELDEPVVGRPPSGVAEDELVQDPVVDLPP
jgi:hypothetical protein